MRFETFRQKMLLPVFTINQAKMVMETEAQVAIQLSRWSKLGKLRKLRQKIYQFPDKEVDEFTLGCLFYKPSYVSLESALNSFGIIPDIPMMTTLVAPVTTKRIRIGGSEYGYSKINQDLFWGYTTQTDAHDERLTYRIAEPEKALLDWIYIRKIRSLYDMRVDKRLLRKTYLERFIKQYPTWVRRAYDTGSV